MKEDNPKWSETDAQQKEDCLNFMLEILNIKVSDDEEQDSINRQMILIADLINSQFQKLTIPEIKEAMKMYVSRQFSEVKVFRLIDCVSIGEILNAYIQHRNIIVEPFLNKRQNLLNAPVEKTQAEKEKIFDDFIKTIYNEIIEKGYSSDAWYIFKKLEDNKKIVVSNENKQELYLKELAIYVPEERKRIIKQNPLNYRSLLNEFEKTYEGKKRPIYVKNRCRSILVSEYVKQHIKSLQELMDSLW